MPKKKTLSAEDLIAGLRRAGGHLPTKASEEAHDKRKKKKRKVRVAKSGTTFE